MDLLPEVLSASVTILSNTSFATKLSVSFGLAFLVYYKTRVAKAPLIIGKEGSFKQFILKCVPIVHEKFSPSPLLFGSSLQTISSTLFKKGININIDNLEDLVLPDQGQVRLWWMNGRRNKPSKDDDNRPIVILLPGLTGTVESNYIRHFVSQIDELGYRAVVFTYRGMGGLELKTAKTYCACYTDDLLHVVDHVRTSYPDSPVMAVGISLGAMILSHYLIRTGSESNLLAAMIISVPWNAFDSKKSLTTPFNRLIFNRHLTQSLLRSVEDHLHMFTDVINIDHVKESSTIHEFDESFTRRVFGFESLDHYYASASIADKCHLIKTPLLALNAYDDPFSPGPSIPIDAINNSDHVAMILTERGGHVAFVDSFFVQGPSYMDRLFTQYVQAIFENKDMVMAAC